MAPVTIKELARQAGVSVASISRALNGLPGVAPDTRTRIETLARELGYAPDGRARALVTGEVPFVGLVVPDITNPFYPEVARGAEQELLAGGYSLLLVSTDWQAERLERALGLLLSHHVAGLLVAVPLNGLLASEAGLDWSRLGAATVVVGQELPRKARGLSVVDVDDRHGGYLVGKHLSANGWRRLAVIAGPERDRSARARIAGFRRALVETGRESELGAVIHGQWSVECGYRAGLELLGGAQSPDGIFAANDLIALGVARAAAEGGRRLGRDLGLVGYDDIDTVRFLEVPVTSVSQPKLELGQRSAELLLGKLAGKPAPPRRTRLRPQLVVRRSCGAARGT